MRAKRAKIFFQLIMALTMDSWVGPFLKGGLTKHCMTPSETAHRWMSLFYSGKKYVEWDILILGLSVGCRNTEKLQSLKLTCLVRLTRMITNGTWVADSKLTTLLCNFLNDTVATCCSKKTAV
ncbi:uncharacterized protein LOC131066076 isoform X1 [Cryptomeria japonica]|uniref:uncharacterized protein LOC131066076 isoform X1 n=2 Tax=Cryptomeria japonica TaxID=3369 RepID=UPI0027DA262D|nr:uncharacterized protein LOC131066076 isoform X1 [Cryptomeria japonica]XP_057856744.2 uncharacterized protein LOC131066076 isoform X1 [Cryptomeria japonica]